MDAHEQLTTLYRELQKQGHAVFAVTLSTFIKSASFASPARMQHMWDQHFIRRVRRRIPEPSPLHHDFVIELSPPLMPVITQEEDRVPAYSTERYFHYHGFLAVQARHANRIWTKGQLNKQLFDSLVSFKSAGKYRPFRIPSFDISPIKSVEAWTAYILKEVTTALSFA